MIFIFLVGLITLALAGVSETFSIIGLSQTFPSIYWSIIAMGVTLGASKLAGVSIVYRYWNIFPKKITIPIAILSFVLTVVTMTGHFGYLSNGYLHDSIGTKQISVQIDSLQAEETRKVERKKEIDMQISQLPSDRAQARIRLAKQFQDEQIEVTKRINELDSKIADLQNKQIDAQSHTGPITYIATAFGLTTDNSIKWLILILVMAFDPMALWLTISISAMVEHRKFLNESENLEPVKAKRIRRSKEAPTTSPLDVFEVAEDVVKTPNDTTPFDVKIRHPFKS